MSDDGLSAKEILSALAPLVRFVDILERFARDPRGFIFGFISTYLVATALGFGNFIVGSILSVFDIVARSLQLAATYLVGSLQVVTTPVLAIGQRLTLIIASVVQSAGPLGPPIAAAITAVLLILAYRLVIAVAGEFPVASTIVDFLGLR